jgi:hypothetical protein
MDLKQIKSIGDPKNYRLTLHAEFERDADQITVEEIEEALFSPEAKIIEEYPNDPRGSSCLVLGFTKQKHPIHVVCGIGGTETLIGNYSGHFFVGANSED